ncbi:glycosyltransferase [Kaistella sp. PBT33-4]|uniref:glycosyltransferase n=1 Tax=Kaistella sp. PBT33-4 TaxID=3032000 RepID=UPI0023D7D1F1|nr:glycosyltransferase [Kaistella sp. PBT33-4]MDF0719109.1 glycosyltransferase [Kaistella sp. PBT33-4]
MKILVSAFSSLYTDQRIEKVCRTLYENGQGIQLIGNDWGGAEEMHRPYPFSRIRIRSRVLRFAYPEFMWKLYKELDRKTDTKTVLLANDLDALLPNMIIARKYKIPLVFDSHEIFTEMPAIKGRWTQKVWKFLERRLVPGLRYMMTESESYAEWFTREYGVHPVVVRNIPRIIKEQITLPENQTKIILYQGAVNQSRGIPSAIRAMHHINGAKLVIAGDGPMRTQYEKLSVDEGLKDRVHFAGKLHPDDLRKLTRTADVGLSLEENGGVSYLYSLPNKVADYIQSRVPVVMINFPEMMKIYNDFKVGEVVQNHDPENLAAMIKTVLEKGRSYYQPELEKAAEHLNWENEEHQILALFEKVKKENFR